MAVRRRPGSARKMMAFSRIVNCHSEEEYRKVHKKAGEKDLVLVEFVAGWSTSSKSMQPYMNTLAKSPEYKDYDPKELKMKLSRNVHKEGDGHWYGYSKRLSTPPRFPSPRSRREKGSHYVSSIGATLFPSEDRIFGTTMRDCMEGGVHGKKQKDIGAGSKPSYPRVGLEYDYEPFSLEMPSHFEGYKGGRIPGEALLDSAKRDFWKVGRLKSLVKHQDGSSPPASRDGPR